MITYNNLPIPITGKAISPWNLLTGANTAEEKAYCTTWGKEGARQEPPLPHTLFGDAHICAQRDVGSSIRKANVVAGRSSDLNDPIQGLIMWKQQSGYEKTQV